MYFCKIENFAYGEINERSFSNPHPRGHLLRPFQVILNLVFFNCRVTCQVDFTTIDGVFGISTTPVLVSGYFQSIIWWQEVFTPFSRHMAHSFLPISSRVYGKSGMPWLVHAFLCTDSHIHMISKYEQIICKPPCSDMRDLTNGIDCWLMGKIVRYILFR